MACHYNYQNVLHLQRKVIDVDQSERQILPPGKQNINNAYVINQIVTCKVLDSISDLLVSKKFKNNFKMTVSIFQTAN